MPEDRFFAEDSSSFPDVRIAETTDDALGGDDGPLNIAPRQLAHRTDYLNHQLQLFSQAFSNFNVDAYTKSESDSKYAVDANFVGFIFAFAASTAPTGWIECAGAELSRTVYANLFNVIGTTYGSGDGLTTFNLPDLRGEFIRGWDHARGIDLNRNMGSFQDEQFPNHTHSNVLVQSGSSVQVTRGNMAMGSITQEVRVRNIALMYCIKY
jgi:microcystin-dependent protein